MEGLITTIRIYSSYQFQFRIEEQWGLFFSPVESVSLFTKAVFVKLLLWISEVVVAWTPLKLVVSRVKLIVRTRNRTL